jgi:hypothetical protein
MGGGLRRGWGYDLRAPRRLLNKLEYSGTMVSTTQLALIAIVCQRCFWDEQQRVSKLLEENPVLKRLLESIPWESFRFLIKATY